MRWQQLDLGVERELHLTGRAAAMHVDTRVCATVWRVSRHARLAARGRASRHPRVVSARCIGILGRLSSWVTIGVWQQRAEAARVSGGVGIDSCWLQRGHYISSMKYR